MKFNIDENGTLLNVENANNQEIIEIPEGVIKIARNALSAYQGLNEVKLPTSLKSIESFAFHGLNNLKKIEIPEGVEHIGDGAFAMCENLKEVKLPHTLKKIRFNTFALCRALKMIEIPEGIQYIGSNAFCCCESLESVKLPNSLEIIDQEAFSYCEELEEIEIPKGVIELGSGTFQDCYKLKRIELPDSLQSIGELAFYNCNSLKRIEIPEGVEGIEYGLFSNCFNLKEVKLPDSIEGVMGKAFNNCKSLERIEIPEGIHWINNSTFSGCTNLKEVKLPQSTNGIQDRVFYNCKSLETLELPEQIKFISQDSFLECSSLQKIIIKNINSLSFNDLENTIKNYKFFYIDRKSKQLICSTKEINDLVGNDKIDINEMKELHTKYLFNRSESLMIILSIGKENFDKLGSNIKCIVIEVLKNTDIRKFDETYTGFFKNQDRFNNLLKQLKKITKFDFREHKTIYSNILNLAYTLGAFSDNEVEKQAACEFISNSFQQGDFTMRSIHGMFDTLNAINYPKSLAREWSTFFRNKSNFKQLIELEKKHSGYITEIYSSFAKIKEYGRKSAGNQLYREVTIDMCKDFFEKVRFNANDRDKDIEKELLKYNDLKNQESFDDAVSIRNEYLKKKDNNELHDHILKEELKEKDVFEQIEEERKNAINNVKGTLEILDEIANNKFTYEFLSKYDAKNFVLGKYCSCCAHLAGAGYGIMKASILHPNCQNLIIKDSKGEIVAKSTLYINREQGYGVFNNVEINNNITDKDELDLIYEKYIKAIEAFATRYNELNKDNPLTQINVGMHLNDLDSQIIENNQKSNEILSAVHFSRYGAAGKLYDGDWRSKQYVVWPKDKKI